MKQQLVSRRDFAKMAGVIAPDIVELCGGRLKAAVVKRQINVNHPAAIEYLQEALAAPKPAVDPHAALVGNQFWRARSSHGRKPKFEDPDVLWGAAVEYFDWAEANPLLEAKGVQVRDDFSIEYIPKMRAMTLGGLRIFLDIGEQTWLEYRRREGFQGVVADIEDAIRTQKFEGAGAGLLNSNIIARDLGLTESTKTEHSGTVGLAELTDDQLDAKLRNLLDADDA